LAGGGRLILTHQITSTGVIGFRVLIMVLIVQAIPPILKHNI